MKKEDFSIEYNDSRIKVFYKSTLFLEWNDKANINYPEDLTWARTIGDVFQKGVELGKLISRASIEGEGNRVD